MSQVRGLSPAPSIDSYSRVRYKSYMSERKVCKKCNKRKALSKFRTQVKNGKEYIRHECRECESKYMMEKKAEVYEEVYAFTHEHGCEECGENDVRLLHFDHLDRKKKHHSVSQLLNARSPDRKKVWKEIDKCRILCANCHALHTAEQMNYYSHYFMEKKDD